MSDALFSNYFEDLFVDDMALTVNFIKVCHSSYN